MSVSTKELNRRKQAVRDAMAKAEVDVIIIGASDKKEQQGLLRYLTDYSVPLFDEFVVLPMDGPLTFFPHYRYGTKHAAHFPAIEHAESIPLLEIHSDPGKKIAEYIKSFRPKRVGIGNRDGISAEFYLSLVHHLGKIQVVDFTKAMNEIKMVKSEEEIKLSEEAIKLNEETFFAYLKGVREGGSEMDAITEAAYFAQKAGGDNQFWLVGSGVQPVQGSISLARERNHVWKKGELNVIVIEIAGPGGYFGEIAHLVCIGDPAPEVVKMHKAVSEAQQIAAKAIKPGVALGDIADVVEQYYVETGYLPKEKENRASATHGNLVGHGQGLDVIEFPTIIIGDQTIVQPGIRFNIHPNVGYPMSCDCYVATEAGARRLSNMPYELIVV